MEANEYLLGHKDNNDFSASGGSGDPEKEPEKENGETLILDATCAPANIRYLQDVSLLNGAREKLETIIYRFHKAYGRPLPRRYKREARKDYFAFAKSRKHTKKKIRGYSANSLDILPETFGIWNGS